MGEKNASPHGPPDGDDPAGKKVSYQPKTKKGTPIKEVPFF